MIRQATTAILAALAGQNVAAYDGAAPDGAALPRVILYTGLPGPVEDTLAGASGGRAGTFQTTCVGVTAEQAKWCAEHTYAALSGVNLPTTPRARVTFLASQPIQKDASIPAEALFYQPITWAIRS